MKLWAITFNTFRETIRDRVLYNLLVFAVLMIILAVVLGRLSFDERTRITMDLGLTAISIFGVFMAVFLGVSLVSKEIEKKTIYTLIAKPLPRTHYILGRYLGLMFTIGVNLLIMSTAFGLILMYANQELAWPIAWPTAQALIMIYIELSIITAVAMVFSSFSTPTLSAIFTLAFFVIGRFTAGILEFTENSRDRVFNLAGKALYYIVPNLTNYVRIESALYGEGLAAPVFLRIIAIGLLTSALFLVMSMAIFRGRDFV